MTNWVKRLDNYSEDGPHFDIRYLGVEPLAQTWINRECLYLNLHNRLTSPKRIQSSRSRAGLNGST